MTLNGRKALLQKKRFTETTRKNWSCLASFHIYEGLSTPKCRPMILHRGPLKKGATFIFTITFANVDRFQ